MTLGLRFEFGIWKCILERRRFESRAKSESNSSEFVRDSLQLDYPALVALQQHLKLVDAVAPVERPGALDAPVVGLGEEDPPPRRVFGVQTRVVID